MLFRSLTFDHDVQKGKIAEIWWDLPEWQRKEAERDVERCMGQPWFHALHPDIQAALSDHNEALFTKYKGSGVRFSSEFGQYFVHAGGAITLLRGAGMDDGVALEGCPCGNKHYKRV